MEAKYALKCGFCDKKVALKKLAGKLKRQLKKARKNNRNKDTKSQKNKKRNKKNQTDSLTPADQMVDIMPDTEVFEKLPEDNTSADEVDLSTDEDISEHEQLIKLVESIPYHEIDELDNDIFESAWEAESDENDIHPMIMVL